MNLPHKGIFLEIKFYLTASYLKVLKAKNYWVDEWPNGDSSILFKIRNCSRVSHIQVEKIAGKYNLSLLKEFGTVSLGKIEYKNIDPKQMKFIVESETQKPDEKSK